MDNMSKHFFCFFQIYLGSEMVVGGLKGQKMAQNDKKFCLSHSASHETYTALLIRQIRRRQKIAVARHLLDGYT